MNISVTRNMKLFSRFLIFFSIFGVIFCGKLMKVRMKALKCEDIDSTIYNSSTYCHLKPTRDGAGKTTILFNFRKPVNDLWVHLKSHFKYGTIFRPWIFEINVNYCDFKKNRNQIPKFANLLLTSLDKNFPGVVHKCPFFGEEGFRNISIDQITSTMFPQIIPKGEYRILFRSHLTDNRTFSNVYMTFLVDATDPLKSFEMGK